MNTTRMHIWTHLKPESKGKTGLGVYPDGMVELDGYVGQLLDKLEELGVADDTVVCLHPRPRRRSDVLAGRRRDALPRREGHQLGGRLARALRGALAGGEQARPGDQRDGLTA